MEQGKTIISSALLPGGTPAGFTDDTLEEFGDVAALSETRQLQVPVGMHGVRLDRVLAELVPEFSRNYLSQLIGSGAVQHRGGQARKASVAVKSGDLIAIELRATPQSQAFKPEMMVLNTVFEDEYLRVIHKPAGLVVHPAPGNWSGTLLNGLLALDSRAADLPRAGIVHRLDKDTSGLMVIARQRQTMDALVKLIAARQVSRQYLALAHRRWNGPDQREVDAAIGRDARNRLRMAVVDLLRHTGKPSQTYFELLQNSEQQCLVRCTLRTGRTHQIRVHLAHIGHPLVGDAVYGGTAVGGMSRQALHAFKLEFSHPVTGELVSFLAPLPDDFDQALKQLGLGYNL